MIKVVKLITGEDIIGDYTETMDNNIIIKNPVTIGMVDRGQLGFIGYMPYAELKDGFVVSKDKVICVLAPESKIETEYQAAFNKLVVPKSPLKIIT